MCLHKMGSTLYSRLEAECEKHIAAQMAHLQAASSTLPDPILFLGHVASAWGKHSADMLLIRSIALYLDRTYVLQVRAVRKPAHWMARQAGCALPLVLQASVLIPEASASRVHPAGALASSSLCPLLSRPTSPPLVRHPSAAALLAPCSHTTLALPHGPLRIPALPSVLSAFCALPFCPSANPFLVPICRTTTLLLLGNPMPFSYHPGCLFPHAALRVVPADERRAVPVGHGAAAVPAAL